MRGLQLLLEGAVSLVLNDVFMNPPWISIIDIMDLLFMDLLCCYGYKERKVLGTIFLIFALILSLSCIRSS